MTSGTLVKSRKHNIENASKTHRPVDNHHFNAHDEVVSQSRERSVQELRRGQLLSPNHCEITKNAPSLSKSLDCHVERFDGVQAAEEKYHEHEYEQGFVRLSYECHHSSCRKRNSCSTSDALLESNCHKNFMNVISGSDNEAIENRTFAISCLQHGQESVNSKDRPCEGVVEVPRRCNIPTSSSYISILQTYCPSYSLTLKPSKVILQDTLRHLLPSSDVDDAIRGILNVFPHALDGIPPFSTVLSITIVSALWVQFIREAHLRASYRDASSMTKVQAIQSVESVEKPPTL